VVVGERQRELASHDDLTVSNHRARVGSPDRQDRRRPHRDDRRPISASHRPDVRDGERRPPQLLRGDRPGACRLGEPVHLPGDLGHVPTVCGANHGDHETVGSIDREADVVVATQQQVVALEGRVELAEFGQDRSHPGDQECLQRHGLTAPDEGGPGGEQVGGIRLGERRDVGDLLPGTGEMPGDRKADRREPHPLDGTRRCGRLDVLPGDAPAGARAGDLAQVDAQIRGEPADHRQGPEPGGVPGLLQSAHHRRGRSEPPLRLGNGRRRGPALAGVADDDQQGPDLQHISFRRSVVEHDPGARSRHLHDRLVRLHLDHRFVHADRAADRHEPSHDRRLGETFADVGQMELERHGQPSRVRRAAATIRAASGR